MQKRLLALVATVAMVLSMFAGIAFAAPKYELVLDNVEITANETDPEKFDLTAEAWVVDPNGNIVELGEGDIEVNGETQGVELDAGKYFVTITLEGLAEGDVTVTYTKVEGVEHVIKLVLDGEEEEEEEDKVYEVVLDETVFYTREKANDLIKVTGKILDGDGNVRNENVYLEIYLPGDDDTPSEADVARSGIISFELSGLAAVGDYKIVVDEDKHDVVNPAGVSSEARFTVLDGEVVTDDDLTFDWSNEGTFEYTARLPLGVTVDEVKLVTEGREFSSNDPDGGVSVYGRWIEISIDKADFDVPGALKLQYTTDNGDTWVTIATGKINKVDISSRLTLSPDTVIYGIGTQNVKATLNLKDLHLNPSTPGADTVDTLFSLGSLDKNKAGSVYTDSATYTFKRNFTSSNYGTHTVKVVVKVNDGIAYEATKTFTVEHPSSSNILGIPEKIKVHDGFNFQPRAYYENDKGDLVEATRFEISYSGPGLTDGMKKVAKGDAFKLAIQEAGIYTLVVEAFDAKGNSVAYETFEVKATGATMTVEPNVVEIKEAADVVVTLVNEDEKPINNATIFFKDGITEVARFTAADLNPNNGVYEIELKATSKLVQNAGDYTIEAWSADGKTLLAAGEFTVLGKTVYEVETDLDNGVLAGRKTKATISVTKGGKVAFPYEFAVYDEDGKLVDTYSYTRSGDDCKVEFTFTEAGEYTIIARNANHSEIGKATFNVVKPVLELTAEKLTNNTKSAFVAKLVDPTDDNKVLKWNVSVKPAYAKLQALELDGKKINVGGTLNLGKLEEYKLDVTMTADYKAAEKAEKVSGLQFVVKDAKEVVIDAVMPIADAKLVSIPEEPVVGQSGTLTLKLVDANEAPLAGYKVFRGDNELGKTDENGEVVYRGRMTDTMTFKAELDAVVDKVTQTVDVTVTPVDDYVAPTVEFEEEVDTPQTTIVISDNVRLTRIRINGEDIDFFATDRYEYVANLVPGVNKFRIEVQDSNYNSEVYNIEIVYNAKSTVLEGDKVQRQGEYLFVQLRQFEELGAELAWNQEAKVATFVVGDTKVEVTIGSTTAKVNGEAVTMPVAAFIDAAQGRTYVPVRFVSEALGWNVHWAAGDIVTITLK